MNCKFTNILVFAAGAAIGSAVTWRILKRKYEQIVQEEIKSIKEAFKDISSNEQNSANEDYDGDDEEEDSDEYDEIQTIYNKRKYPDKDVHEYVKLVNNYTSKKGGAEDVTTKPYVISPYDFGELEDYHQIELTYYADGTLEDSDYQIVTDIDEIIGADSLQTFGEYEDDSVFVRNEFLRTDFQILRDPRTYEEARSIGPDKVDN